MDERQRKKSPEQKDRARPHESLQAMVRRLQEDCRKDSTVKSNSHLSVLFLHIYLHVCIVNACVQVHMSVHIFRQVPVCMCMHMHVKPWSVFLYQFAPLFSETGSCH